MEGKEKSSGGEGGCGYSLKKKVNRDDDPNQLGGDGHDTRHHDPLSLSESSSINPLNIPGILSDVLKNVSSVKDLKNARLVNKSWRDECCDHWRSTAVFLINQETLAVLTKVLIKNQEANEDGSNPSDVFRLLEKPFQNYRFKKVYGRDGDWCFPPPGVVEEVVEDEDDHSVERAINDADSSEAGDQSEPTPLPSKEEMDVKWSIFEKLGGQMKFLDLGHCIIRSVVGGHVAGLKWILRSCHNLRELVFIPQITVRSWDLFSPVGGDGDNKPSTFIAEKLESLTIGGELKWCNVNRCYLDPLFSGNRATLCWEFMKMLPNLKALHLLVDWQSVNQFLVNLKNVIPSTGKSIQLEKINVLAKPSGEYLNDLQTYFERATPPLNYLKLEITGRQARDKSEHFHQALKFVGDTLTVLDITVNCDDYSRFTPPYSVIDFSEGNFPNLIKLYVTLAYSTFEGQLISFPFTTFRTTPKLKSFAFVSTKTVEKSWVIEKLAVADLADFGEGMDDQNKIRLADLEEFQIHRNFTAEAIQLLGKGMKNLRRFGAVLDNENLSTVMETWPYLQQLTLLPCSSVKKVTISKLEEIFIHSGLIIVDKSSSYSQPHDPYADFADFDEFRYDQFQRM